MRRLGLRGCLDSRTSVEVMKLWMTAEKQTYLMSRALQLLSHRICRVRCLFPTPASGTSVMYSPNLTTALTFLAFVKINSPFGKVPVISKKLDIISWAQSIYIPKSLGKVWHGKTNRHPGPALRTYSVRCSRF